MPDFLPRREAGLLDWSANFSAKVNATPEAYGLMAEEAGGFAAVQQAYAHWYTLANQPSTRTVRSVLIKNAARKAMVAKARALARRVRADAGVSPERLSALGLRVPGRARRHVARPGEAPVVEIAWERGHRQVVRLTEPVTGRGRKPPGVSAALLMIATGDRPPLPMGKSADVLRTCVERIERAATVRERAKPQPRRTAPSRSRLVKTEDDKSVPRGDRVPASEGGGTDWRFWRATGRLRVALEPAIGLRPGTKVWVTACWINDRGEQGPWSEPAWAPAPAALPVLPSGLRLAG